MTTTPRLFAAAAACALALGLTACSSGSTPSGSAPSGATAPTTSSGTTGTAPAASAEKISANTASEDEIAAALENAGVSNPERWAEEVVEYRPYPADDPNLSKLREELAKYNPGQETTDKIVSALQP